MATAGKTELWNGPQHPPRWMSEHGNLPAPVSFAVCRETLTPEGGLITAYTVLGDIAALTPLDFRQWLLRHRLAGADGIGLSLLVIRETLDREGLISDCIIERRRGALDGPLCGAPARIAFRGPAGAVRLYAIEAGDRLTEIPPSALIRRPCAIEASSLQESFSGEERALRARFGPTALVVGRRAPTVSEDMIGLSSIVHVRTGDAEVGCGIGWHGPVAYTLVAAFPRFDQGPALPSADERAVAAAIETHRLVRHETRHDTAGPGVVARRRDGPELFIVRPDGGGATVTPYTPDPASVGSPDQRRWMRYAEAHEARTILDAYQDGGSDDLIVLTGDTDGEVWRHRIDTDGVEIGRDPANDTAVAVRHRAGRNSQAGQPCAECTASVWTTPCCKDPA